MLKLSKKNQQGTIPGKGIIGIDEVGRGPLAGPITVAACYIEDEKQVLKDIFQNTIRDSKMLKKHNRNNIYETIRYKRYYKSCVKYSVHSRSASYIDTFGIQKAASACILDCVRDLGRMGVDIENVVIRLDAGLEVPLDSVTQESFVKGDRLYVEIALASIMAKVTRDRYMERLGIAHPEYEWGSNVGYGTKKHRESITKYGITKYHRKSYLKAFKLLDKAE